MLSTVAACNLLKRGGADAGDAAAEGGGTGEAPGADGAATAAPTADTTPAANENDIARFPDETKLDNVAATVMRYTTVREAPLSGKPVTSLSKGANVTELASRGQYFLVSFDSSGKKLMGWIHQDSFKELTVDAGIKAPVCAAPEIAVYSDEAFCGRPCASDGDCGAGMACKGTALKIVKNQLGAKIAVCTAFQRPAVVDAGPAPVAVVDAGPAPIAVVDSGVKPQSIADVSEPPCAAGTVLLNKDHRCHKSCASGVGACAGACVVCEGQRVCTPMMQRNFCK